MRRLILGVRVALVVTVRLEVEYESCGTKLFDERPRLLKGATVVPTREQGACYSFFLVRAKQCFRCGGLGLPWEGGGVCENERVE